MSHDMAAPLCFAAKIKWYGIEGPPCHKVTWNENPTWRFYHTQRILLILSLSLGLVSLLNIIICPKMLFCIMQWEKTNRTRPDSIQVSITQGIGHHWFPLSCFFQREPYLSSQRTETKALQIWSTRESLWVRNRTESPSKKWLVEKKTLLWL